MNYLQTITADHSQLLQALQATATARPCVVILTPESRIPCGATTFINYVVRKLYQCYNSPAHPDQAFITALQAYQASQCVIMAPLECRRDGFVDDVVKEASESLFCNRPIWIYSYQQPEAPQVKVPVYTIRLKPVPRIDSNFPIETFTATFYTELKALIPELTSSATSRVKLHLTGSVGQQTVRVNKPDLLNRHLTEYWADLPNQDESSPKIPQQCHQASLIHDLVASLPACAQIFTDDTTISSFNFTISYSQVDSTGHKTTTRISHDFNAELDPAQAQVSLSCG